MGLYVSPVLGTHSGQRQQCMLRNKRMNSAIYLLFVFLDSLFTLLSFLKSTPILTISAGSLVLFQLNLASKESWTDDQKEGRQINWLFSAPAIYLWNSSRVATLLTLKIISLINPPQFILIEYTIFILLRPWLIHYFWYIFVYMSLIPRLYTYVSHITYNMIFNKKVNWRSIFCQRK